MNSNDQNENLIAADGEPKECLSSVTFPTELVHVYNTVESANKLCTAPTPGNFANALLATKAQLLAIGKTYCASGSNDCESRNCVPSLSNFTVQSNVVGSRINADNKKECIITVKATGTISCFCGA